MKKAIFLVVFLWSNIFYSTAQVLNPQANPQIYGRNVFKFLADGDNLIRQGLFEEAILSYDNAVAQNPALAEALVRRAIAKYRIGRVTEAEQDMRIANTINPYAGSLHGVGDKNNRLKVLAFEPMELILQPNMDYILDYYKTFWQTTNVNLQEIEITQNNVNEIEEEILIAQIIEWIEQDELDRAETVLLAKNNLQAEDYNLLGIIKKQSLQWEVAYQNFEKAIQLTPTNASSYYFMSLIKTHDKNYQKALDLVNTALLYNPEMLKAHFHKAVLHKMLEEPEKAFKTYEFLEDEIQLTYETHVNLAITKKLMGNPNGALTHIEQAIDLQGKNTEDPVLYKLRGNIYMLINNYNQAIKDYNKAIELDNNFAEAYFNLAMAQILQFNRADACYNLQKSITLGYLKGGEKMKYFCVY